jgi:hypothetical protein
VDKPFHMFILSYCLLETNCMMDCGISDNWRCCFIIYLRSCGEAWGAGSAAL